MSDNPMIGYWKQHLKPEQPNMMEALIEAICIGEDKELESEKRIKE